jgi:exopolysaccharide production protein ExoZ
MFPLLGVGWTLNLEMIFYAIFAFALRVNRRWAPFITITVIGAFHMMGALSGSTDSILGFYAHPYTIYFVLGIATYYVWNSLPVDVSACGRRAAVACSVIFFPLFVAWAIQGNLAESILTYLRIVPRSLLSFIFPAILVFLVLWLHTVGIRCRFRWPVVLGDAFYALYLSHLIIVGTVQTISQKWIWLDPRYHAWSLLFVLASTSLFALAIYQWVERPLIKRARCKWESIKSTRPGRVAPN